MNVHTYLVKPPQKEGGGGGGEEKVASALIFADYLQVFAAVYMQVPVGLIRGNGVGPLQLSHARLFPAQQPAEEKGREVHNYQAHIARTSDTFSLQRLHSVEQKGHFFV